MFEDFIKRIVADIARETERRKEQETNKLMAEIEAFHIKNAIDAALENNDRVSFLQLTGGR